MPNFILILSLFVVMSACKGQEKITYAPIVLKAKETSLYTKDINWDTVNKEYLRLTKGKESVEELKPGLQ